MKYFSWHWFVLFAGPATAIVGCGSGSEAPSTSSESSSIVVSGVGWHGTLAGMQVEAVVVESCVNQECREQVVPVAGLAPASRWDAMLAAEPAPEGAPASAALQAPVAGECKLFTQWVEGVGVSSCATVQTEGPPAIALQFFLDLTVMSDELSDGDAASLVLKDEADGGTLLELAEVINEPAPYYVRFQF